MAASTETQQDAIKPTMPIKIPDHLPAARTLQDEGVVLITENDAIRQDIRPMRIALLNLMPEKIKTETQLARLIGATPLQIELTLLRTASYTAKNTSPEHMDAFYRTWEEVKAQKYDGLIVTGAPVEEMEFENVLYWQELTEILDWARENVFRSFNICWGAQAALFHHYGIPKYALPQKLSGIYEHKLTRRNAELLRGFNDRINVPVSRYTENRAEDIEGHNGLEILVYSDESGLCLIQDHNLGAVYIFNHFEYDTGTLRDEYGRDLEARPDAVHLPVNYFPDDDPAKDARNSWRAHGHLLFSNWINEMYQNTPFDIDRIGRPAGE